MAPSLTADAAASLRQYIDDATKTDKPELPGAILHIVDANNNILFTHGSGQTTIPTAQSIGIIHSLSKFVGAIAFLRLVERGFVDLDDPTVVPTLLPELAAQKVLIGYLEGEDGKKKWQFEDRRGDITPRMLLNHTHGSGHTYLNPLLFSYLQELGIWDKTNEVADPYGTILASPLLWHPGTHTNYGQGLDWIAVLIERLTKMSLAEYLQENIFGPLGLGTMGFEPVYGGDVLSRKENEGKFWPRTLKLDSSSVNMDTTELERKLREDAWPKGKYHAGCLGTGLLSSAEDYARLLVILLPQNGGVDPATGYCLLSPDSVKEIMTPQLPNGIRNNSRSIPASGASPIVLPVALGAPHMDPNGSFGLACGVQGALRTLQDGKQGRREGTVYWYGAANTEFWIDDEEGIVVFVNGNYYPWNDQAWMDFVAGVEGRIYEGLSK